MEVAETNQLGPASGYLTRGMSPVPMGPDKHPPIRWKEYQTRLPTEDEMIGWDWDLGVMIVTGAISGAVTLDADSAEAAAYVYSQGIPDDTPRFRTPKGMQFVFKHPGVPVKTVARFIDGVKLDMKGDEGVTAVPPTPWSRLGNRPAGRPGPAARRTALGLTCPCRR